MGHSNVLIVLVYGRVTPAALNGVDIGVVAVADFGEKCRLATYNPQNAIASATMQAVRMAPLTMYGLLGARFTGLQYTVETVRGNWREGSQLAELPQLLPGCAER